jgi:hypothetical protein
MLNENVIAKCKCILLMGPLMLPVMVAAQKLPTITQTGHTVKVEQLSGPCDWSSWDPKTPYGTPGPCGQTAAQAYPSQVLAQGLGYSFEDTATGNLMLLFGDTVGYDPSADPSFPHLRPDPAKGSFPPSAQFHAKDTMAMSTTATAGNVFSIQYYTSPPPDNPSAPLFITEPGKEYLPPQPNGEQPSYVAEGANVTMGAHDIPNSGISLNKETYLIVNTGAQIAKGKLAAYSVLVKFDGVSTFTTGRTVSETNYNYGAKTIVVGDKTITPQPLPGHFVLDALAQIEAPFTLPIGPCSPPSCFNNPAVGIWGNGQFRDSSLYFSYIPVSEFWSGVDGDGNPATVYFAGYKADGTTPIWSNSEYSAVSVLPADATVGNASLFYDSNSSLWMMIFDGQVEDAKGIHFTYARNPWGPWQPSQLIYNKCQAHTDNNQGFGDFIFYYADENHNDCPAALPPGTTKFPASAGPAGPVIGSGSDPFGADAFTTPGAAFAPEIIGRFSGSKDGMLKLQYTISTWNPYAVVRMETDFTISK